MSAIIVAAITPQLRRMAPRLSGIASLLTLVAAGGLGAAGMVYAQDTGVRLNSVSLHVLPWNSSSPYRDGLDGRVLHWIYSGEPFVVELSLLNNTSQAITARREGVEWWDASKFSLESIDQGAEPQTVLTLSERVFYRRSVSRSSDQSVSPGSSERVVLQLQREDGPVPPRIYRLVVSLDSSFLGGAGRRTDVIRDERIVGFRSLGTRGDRMNAHIHLAWWRQQSRDYRAAREEIQQLLLLNPTSGIAYTYLGNIAEQERNCVEAMHQWQKAIEIFTLDGDPEDGSAGMIGRAEGINNLRTRAARCH